MELLSPAHPSRPDTTYVFSDNQTISEKLFSKKTSNTSSLRKFATEIRHMVYEYVLVDSWDGSTQEFLAALRADPFLYVETVAFFNKHNTFSLTKKNRWLKGYFWREDYDERERVVDTQVKQMCENLQKVFIEVPLQEENPGSLASWPSLTPSFDRCVLIMELTKNITTLHISVVYYPNLAHPEWLELIKHLVKPLQKLTKLSATWPGRFIDARGLSLGKTLAMVNQALNADPRVEQVETGGDITWVWNAEKENTIKWHVDPLWESGLMEDMAVDDILLSGHHDEQAESMGSHWSQVGEKKAMRIAWWGGAFWMPPVPALCEEDRETGMWEDRRVVPDLEDGASWEEVEKYRREAKREVDDDEETVLLDRYK